MEENMKIRITLISSIVLSALFLAAPVASAKKHGGGGDTESHRRKGVELIDAKQFDQAIAEFNREVEAAPGEPEAYRDRGTAYRAAARAAELAGDQAGASAKYSSAGTDFLKKIELAPQKAARYIQRAQNQ